MAQDPNKPRDNGKIGLPPVDTAMNKLPPLKKSGGKGVKEDGSFGNKDDPDQKILLQARKRFDRCVQSEGDNRKRALEDTKFLNGDQWPADVAAQRNTDKRPCLTFNKLKTFVHQVTNPQRENRPAINISPVGDKVDVKAAKMFGGVIRHIERDSRADIAYDTAFWQAASCGFGYWRVDTEYEGPDSFDQKIVIRRIRNQFTVYMDPDAQIPTGQDAKFGFVTEMMPSDVYKEMYPDSEMIGFNPSGAGDTYKEWVSKDSVRLAEYYTIEHTMRDLVQLDNGHKGWKDELAQEIQDQIAAGTIKITAERESEEKKCMWYKINAIEILERTEVKTEGLIPIVRVIGDEIDEQGKVTYSGIVRDAKDPQRMYNYWRCLSLDTPVATPSGWKTMGSLVEGDQVFGTDGKPCNVLGFSPTHIHRTCYRVEFDNGSSVVSDAEHPWLVEERGTRKSQSWNWTKKIVTTEQLTSKSHYIEQHDPLDLPHADLPIDPYALGVWLGDGASEGGRITQSADDIEELRSLIGESAMPAKPCADRAPNFRIEGLTSKLNQAGLLGNKHIPSAYLRASAEQRLALFQGLMDTDGSVDAKSQCSFTNTNERIAEGFAELASSLGIKTNVIKRTGRVRMWADGRPSSEHADAWQFSFSAFDDMPVFRLSRKVSRLRSSALKVPRRLRVGIKSVTPIDSVPVRCIAVDSENHLFLVGKGMVATHNTTEAEIVALQPKAPYIMEEGQAEGHEPEWKQANVKAFPVLYYKGTTIGGKPAPPPQRQSMVQAPAGVLQAIQGAAQDMQAVTGIRFDATISERVHDESGKALHELRRSGDIGSLHYEDNLARALDYTGLLIIRMFPNYYDTPRVLTILREDGKAQTVKVDPHAPKALSMGKGVDGKALPIFNPTIGKYGVTATAGPSYATKRIEAADQMMKFVAAMPSIGEKVADLIAKNQDWPDADQFAARLAKTLPPQLLVPDMADVDPQIQAFIQSMQMQLKQMGMEKMQMIKQLQDQTADRMLMQDKTDKDFQAKVMAVIQKMQAAGQKADTTFADTVLKTADMLHGQHMDLTNQAMQGQQFDAGRQDQQAQQQADQKPQ